MQNYLKLKEEKLKHPLVFFFRVQIQCCDAMEICVPTDVCIMQHRANSSRGGGGGGS